MNPQLSKLYAQLIAQRNLQAISSFKPEEQPVFEAPLGTVDYPVDDPRDWEQDIFGRWKKKSGNI